MTALTSILLGSFLFNCVLVSSSSSILGPLKSEDELRIFKEIPNDIEYVIKRQHSDAEEPDSKERRSSSGSSFIRFGRAGFEGNLEKANYGGGDLDGRLKVNRYPRWKSPDIVIRFGRSGYKAADGERGYKRGRNDLNFIRFGRNIQVYPLELDLPTVCSELGSSDHPDKSARPLDARLLRLCNVFNNPEDDPRSALEFLDEPRQPKQQE